MPAPQQDMPISELYALLRKRGWITRLDFVFVFTLVVLFVNCVLMWFALPEHRWQVTTISFLMLIIELLVWLVILSFRIAYFAIIIQASLDEMPATSARLAVRFLRTGIPAGTPGA